jgi:predicted nucleotidyltransferase component of viral defense system
LKVNKEIKLITNCDIDKWVSDAEEHELEFREAVHTVLAAIAQSKNLNDNMIIKGGILLAIRYRSNRFTRDIDFSTPKKLNEIKPEEVRSYMDSALSQIVETLDYDLDCRVQKCKANPKDPEASFPNIELKIGYAYKGTPKHRRLLAGQSSTTISIDYSLNEQTPNVENLLLGNGGELQAYALTDLIAEKYRAVLQQAERNRQRRQDIFDLYFLLESTKDLGPDEKYDIISSLMIKSRSRGIEPTINSMNNPEIYERAKAEYPTLSSEIEGDLPDFDHIYTHVKGFYQSLDWPP